MVNSKEKELVELASRIVSNPNDFTRSEKDEVVASLGKMAASSSSSWWIIVLKVLAYAIGLILGGAVTTSCIHFIG